MMNSAVKIAAVADIHSPRYLQLYLQALRRIHDKPDVLIWVGDIVDKNNVEATTPVYEATRKHLEECPIIAVFGNEEYRGFEEKYIEKTPGVLWINDEIRILTVNEIRIGFIGTRGALDKPTPWQQKNMPWLLNYYKELPQRIIDLARNARNDVDKLVLISHYGVTRRNLRGENPRVWPYLASTGMEKIIKTELFDLVIHGHAHKASIERIDLYGTPVYNVSLPGRKKITLINISARKGLLQWIR